MSADEPVPPDITQNLASASPGDADSSERLLPLIYSELRRLAEDPSPSVRAAARRSLAALDVQAR